MGCPSILFVDDDVMTQWVMTEVLSRSGYTVTSVCRCEDAIELLGDASEFDLLLVDLDLLDGLDGSSLITQWRKAAPGRAAIFTSVLGFPLRRLNRHEHFMHRPFSAGRLLETVELAMEEAMFQPSYPGAVHGCQHVH